MWSSFLGLVADTVPSIFHVLTHSFLLAVLGATAAVLHQYEQEAEESEAVAQEEKTMEEKEVHISEMKDNQKSETEAKLKMVTQLVARGFSIGQIQLLKPVMLQIDFDQLTTIFAPDMTEEEIKSILSILED